MTIFDHLEKSITIEFHGGVDSLERKMLGIWADERFKKANIGIRLENEKVVISIGPKIITKFPFPVFESLSVKEIGEIIVREFREKA
tara:strand:+ start:4221 stop:4481 length:261 start_codon:yes stop_codon:yes gene_type:complete